MKKLIILLLFLSCNKSIKQLINKGKINEKYWQYIIEDKAKELEEYLRDNVIDFNQKNEEGEIPLTLAARFNSLRVMNFILNDDLIKQKIDVNAKNSDGKTALISSILGSAKCLKKDLIIRKLLNIGADTNIRYGAGCNTLMLAIIQGDTNTVKQILNKEIDINAQNLFGEAALILAVKRDINEEQKIELVNKILEKEDIQINLQDREGKSALTHAVINNNPKIVSILSNRKDININILDKEKRAPLDHLDFKDFEIELSIDLIKNGAMVNDKKYFYSKAQQQYLVDIISFLIEGAGDINYTKDNKDLLQWSITLFNNNMDISLKLVKYLIEKMEIASNSIKNYIEHADKRNSDLFYVLKIISNKASKIYSLIEENLKDIGNEQEIIKRNFFNTISKGNIFTAQFLIKKIVDIDDIYINGKKPLIEASKNGHINLVKLLLENRANINIKDKKGQTALFKTAKKGSIDIAEILIAKGADVNIKDLSGKTLLMHAALQGNKDFIKLLIAKGANIEDKDPLGQNALMYSFPKDNTDIVEIFLKETLDIEEKNKDGKSLLILASELGSKNIVKLLLEKKLDLNYKDNLGLTALVSALRNGHIEVVRLILNEGQNVNSMDPTGITLLMLACEFGHKNIVELLIEEGANIYLKDSYGETALMHSIRADQEDIVKIFLEKFINLNEKISLTAPLNLALSNNYINIAKLLLRAGADINRIDRYGKGALYHSKNFKDEEMVSLLLERGLNINQTEIFENDYEKIASILLDEYEILRIKNIIQDDSPLIKAININMIELMDFLMIKLTNIDNKEDMRKILINIFIKFKEDILNLFKSKEANGTLDLISVEKDYSIMIKEWQDIEDDVILADSSPLVEAVCRNKINLIEILLSKGIDVNQKDLRGRAALIEATIRNQKDVVKLLLKNGADVKIKCKDGNTAMMLATKHKYKDILEILLTTGSNINEKNEFGRTALMEAIMKGEKDLVELLLKNGADVNTKGENGDSILMYSVFCNKIDILKLLLENGADINQKNNNSENALIFTMKFLGFDIGTEIFNVLIEEGINVNDKGKYGETALMYSILMNKKDLTKFLIEKGADVNQGDKEGVTPLERAICFSDEEIVELILTRKSKYCGYKELITYLSTTVKAFSKYNNHFQSKRHKNHIIMFKYILKIMLKDYLILYKNLERAFLIRDKDSLKEEINNKIKILNLLLKMPPELLLFIAEYI